MEAHKDQYMRAAKTLGLIDPIKPDLTENYELGMVFGASRIGLYARLVRTAILHEARS
jgi:hypothetical protein